MTKDKSDKLINKINHCRYKEHMLLLLTFLFQRERKNATRVTKDMTMTLTRWRSYLTSQVVLPPTINDQTEVYLEQSVSKRAFFKASSSIVMQSSFPSPDLLRATFSDLKFLFICFCSFRSFLAFPD